VHRWQARLAQPGVTGECFFERKRTGLVFQPARLTLLIKERGTFVGELPSPWDSELNDWTIERGLRAATLQNEGERFGLTFNDRLYPIALRYGDGFFNAVLIQHLMREGFSDVAPTNRKLERIRENRPMSGEPASDCALLIESAIQTIAGNLLRGLTYSRAEAQAVLADGMAYYLDERFNITNAELLGFSRD